MENNKKIEHDENNEPKKFVLKFSQRLDLRSSSKHVTLQKLSIYYTWKNRRQHYKNNKLNIITPTWNNEFELPDDSYTVSNIPYYIRYILKNAKHYLLIILFIFTSIELVAD